MKYRLNEYSTNNTDNIIPQILMNRGITDWQSYMEIDKWDAQSWNLLDNIFDAVELLDKNKNHKITILIDEDVDGFCSAAMIYSYLKNKLNYDNINYIFHQKTKAHGLTDDVMGKLIGGYNRYCDLLIIPDAGSNDIQQLQKLNKEAMDVIILDHHEIENEQTEKITNDCTVSGNTIIVNNQSSKKYYNKDLCGAGIVYRFLQALDDYYWTEYADDYIDLCALANIADVMDMRSFETRYFVNKGLKNIQNQCFQGFIDACSYNIGDDITVHNVQWNVVPMMNALIRMGTYEEKELLFRALTEVDETFIYDKKATKNKPAETIEESIYDRVPRLCLNARNRQKSLKEKNTIATFNFLNGSEHLDNQVIMFDGTELVDYRISGLVAIQISEKYGKPCIILRQRDDDENLYCGSARNIDNSPISNFKDIVNSTSTMNAAGHASAFGIVSLNSSDIDKAQEELNTLLKDIEYDATYVVDFILEADDITTRLVVEFSKFNIYEGQGVEKPLIAIENVELKKTDLSIIGKNEDTIKFTINDVDYVYFKVPKNSSLYQFIDSFSDNNDTIRFTVVGQANINTYQGVKTPQITIKDINVLEICEK